MRKAQFQHVFTFLMLLFIAGVVLLLGYKFLSDILGSDCEIQQTTFSQDLQRALKAYASYGSYHAVALDAPCDAARICFVAASVFTDTDGDELPGSTSDVEWVNSNTQYDVIQYEVNNPSSTPSNIFLFDAKGGTIARPQFFGDKIAVDPATRPLCVDAKNGKFRIGFTGQGRTVLLTDIS